jgi:hypothetical protein
VADGALERTLFSIALIAEPTDTESADSLLLKFHDYADTMAHDQTDRRPPAVPLEFAGKWIAWNSTQTRIVASGDSLPAVRQAAHAAGEEEPIFAKAPRANIRFTGAQ